VSSPQAGPDPASEPDFDRRWAELADQLDESLPSDLKDWATDSSRRVVWGPDPAAFGAAADPSADAVPSAPEHVTPPGPRDWAPPEEDEHFIPPDPPPILAGQPVVVIAWVALLGGVLTLLARAILGAAVPILWARIGLAAVVIGAALLIARLPRGREDLVDDQYGPSDE
jgi:hypothetical protein